MSPKTTNPKDFIAGGVLTCAEAITLGMPLEVWKTHMGTYRKEGTIEAFRNIYNKGGVAQFWSGWQPKMVECFLKGGILLFAKDAIIRASKNLGCNNVTSGLLGGFGGGVAQVIVMGPCTFLVTASVAGDKSLSLLGLITKIFKEQGIGGFYHGGTALMLRQGTNWASRQGFTDVARSYLLSRRNDEVGHNKKLTVLEEAISGIFGGMVSTWNQPFEVLRIEAQANAARGLPVKSVLQTFALILKENGPQGLFQGILPRMGISVWQTVFMISLPYVLKQYGLGW